MNGKEATRTALQPTQQTLGMYLGDLSDQDLLVLPVPNANHIAWQIGHLISSERHLLSIIPGAVYPELPAGFDEQHKPTNAATDSPKGFATKAQYLDLFNKT